MNWFSNKGQIIQVVIQLCALLIAAIVAYQQNFISLIFAVVAVPICLFGFLWLMRSAQQPPPKEIMAPKVPPSGKPHSAKWEVRKFRLQEGARWYVKGSLGTNAIEIKFIQMESKPSASAKIEVRTDIGNAVVGRDCVSYGDRTYSIPESSHSDIDRTFISGMFTEQMVQSYIIRVEHIDNMSRVADFEVMIIGGSIF